MKLTASAILLAMAKKESQVMNLTALSIPVTQDQESGDK